MKKYIYFIRHAESPFIFGEERSRPLSEQGEKDSLKIKDRLESVDFDIFICSPYVRAIQTIKPLSNLNEIFIEEGLKEKRMKGEYKLSENELNNAICNSFKDKDFYLNGGESTQEVWDRSIPIIKGLLDNVSYENIAIGTHGNIMTCILSYFNPSIGYDFWKNSTKPDIYKLTFDKHDLLDIQRLNYND